MPTLYPYLVVGGINKEGFRLFAFGYLAVAVFLVLFWVWWVSQPPPATEEKYVLATPREVLPGFYEGILVTRTIPTVEP